jgi:hypothetical protein
VHAEKQKGRTTGRGDGLIPGLHLLRAVVWPTKKQHKVKQETQNQKMADRTQQHQLNQQLRQEEQQRSPADGRENLGRPGLPAEEAADPGRGGNAAPKAQAKEVEAKPATRMMDAPAKTAGYG